MAMNDRDYVYDPRTAQAVGTFSTRVYGWLALGLGFTAVVAYFTFVTGLYLKLLPFYWVLALGTLGIAMAFNVSVVRSSIPKVMGMFLTYAGVQGLLFGTILPAFAAAFGGQVIWLAFVTASAIFLLAMCYGMFTKNDLTTLGRILTFALLGLVAVTLLYFILSLFLPIGPMNLLISYIGLIIFIGLTAYDAQRIRQYSLQADVNSVASYKLSLVLALQMYINVIMIFWYLLRIFSSGKK